MRIILPSATIVEKDLHQLSIPQRIDRCASVCYQRPSKPDYEEALNFCKKYGIDSGHRAMLEFATIHLTMDSMMAEELECEKYLKASPISETKWCVSGSIRAWMEAPSDIAEHIREHFLAFHFPFFFGEPHLGKNLSISFSVDSEVPITHIHVAVRIVTSRAITHELVRHRPCSFLQESQRYVRYDKEVVFIRPLWACYSTMDNLFQDECYDCEQAYTERRAMGMSPQLARGVLNNDCKAEILIYTHLAEWDHIFGLRCAQAADPEMRRIMIPLRNDFHKVYSNYPWSPSHEV